MLSDEVAVNSTFEEWEFACCCTVEGRLEWVRDFMLAVYLS